MATELLDCRLLVVTGKGGVGKTTVAAALAWQAAKLGKRVLVCELDAKGDLLSALGQSLAARGDNNAGRSQDALTFDPRELHPRLHAMAMDPEASLKEYLRLNLRIPFVTRVGALSNAFDFLANAAPGVREIVTIGKLAYEVRERHYDLVIADAPATGHIAGLLRAPQAINDLVGVGLIRSQTAWILDILNDADTTGVVLTTTSEELPVNESLELLDRLRADIHVDCAAVVVNRLLPQTLTEADGHAIAKLAMKLELRGTDSALRDVLSGAGLLDALSRSRAPHLTRLLAAWTGPLALVPTITNEPAGLPVTRVVAEHLADELSLHAESADTARTSGTAEPTSTGRRTRTPR